MKKQLVELQLHSDFNELLYEISHEKAILIAELIKKYNYAFITPAHDGDWIAFRYETDKEFRLRKQKENARRNKSDQIQLKKLKHLAELMGYTLTKQ